VFIKLKHQSRTARRVFHTLTAGTESLYLKRV
jgi:hypothetical protein